MRHFYGHIKYGLLFSIALAFVLHFYMPFQLGLQLSYLKNESVVERLQDAETKEIVFSREVYAKLEKPDKHEIKIGDHYYDVVSQLVEGDKVYCKVLVDDEETSIRRAITRHHSGGKTHHRTKRINFWWPLSNQTSTIHIVYSILANDIKQYHNRPTSVNLKEYIADNLIPPEA